MLCSMNRRTRQRTKAEQVWWEEFSRQCHQMGEGIREMQRERAEKERKEKLRTIKVGA